MQLLLLMVSLTQICFLFKQNNKSEYFGGTFHQLYELGVPILWVGKLSLGNQLCGCPHKELGWSVGLPRCAVCLGACLGPQSLHLGLRAGCAC